MNKAEANPFYERYLLTVDEAVAYFRIGAKRMYELVTARSGEKWIFRSGKRLMIRRELFGRWLDEQAAIR